MEVLVCQPSMLTASGCTQKDPLEDDGPLGLAPFGGEQLLLGPLGGGDPGNMVKTSAGCEHIGLYPWALEMIGWNYGINMNKYKRKHSG